MIGGFTPPGTSGRQGFGALLLGYYDANREGNKLRYAGRVGTGFSNSLLRSLHAELVKIEQRESPFADLKKATGSIEGARWVKPRLVAQIAFSERTRDGQLRHPSFLGLREDKAVSEVDY